MSSVEKKHLEKIELLKKASRAELFSKIINLPKIETVLKSDKAEVYFAGKFKESDYDEIIHLLKPWRKGPFRLNDYLIDAEWDSYLKWQRIEPLLGKIENKRILDIGCNNAYYLFRLLEQNPEKILGIDPVEIFYLQYLFLNKFNPFEKKIDFKLLGIEDLDLFEEKFDLILCMGIVYHHPNPIEILSKVRERLAKGGKLILETSGVDSKEDIAYFPKKTYSGCRGWWFIPSAGCLENWLRRSGYQKVKIKLQTKVLSNEQRKTDFSGNFSLEDGIDQKEPELTVEGYPAPVRIIAEAFK